MEEKIKEIVDKYGKDALLNSKRFVSIFADLNPQMKRERKLLESALAENIAELFINCAENERQTCIIKVKRKLKNAYIAEEGINDIIKWFTYSLGWQYEYDEVKKELDESSNRAVHDSSNKTKLVDNESLKEDRSSENSTSRVLDTKKNINKDEENYLDNNKIKGKKVDLVGLFIAPALLGLAIVFFEYNERKQMPIQLFLYDFLTGYMTIFIPLLLGHKIKNDLYRKIFYFVGFIVVGVIIGISTDGIWDEVLASLE